MKEFADGESKFPAFPPPVWREVSCRVGVGERPHTVLGPAGLVIQFAAQGTPSPFPHLFGGFWLGGCGGFIQEEVLF